MAKTTKQATIDKVKAALRKKAEREKAEQPEQQELRPSDTPDALREEIIDALNLFHPKGAVIELRVLDSEGPKKHGYYDDLAKLSYDAVRRNQDPTVNCYFIPNELTDELIARERDADNLNILQPGAGATTDADIKRRRWLDLDIDPERAVPNTSATDEESQRAEDLAAEVAEYLRGQGFPEPVWMFSGSGYRLLYKVDWPNTEGTTNAIERLIDALNKRFPKDEYGADVDPTAKNAARLCKLPGTIAHKGPHTDERPHRLASVVEDIPEPIEELSLATFENLVGPITEPEPKPTSALTQGREYDIPAILTAAGIDYTIDESFQPKNGGAGTKYLLHTCPWADEHTDGRSEGSYVTDYEDSGYDFYCAHKHCEGRRWDAFKKKLGLSRDLPITAEAREFAERLLNSTGTPEPSPFAPSPITFGYVPIDELMAVEVTVDYLIQDILVADQMGVISGAAKAQKTHIGMAAALALATGRPFLNQFPVPAKKRVGFFYGEGGRGALRQTLHAQLRFYGFNPHAHPLGDTFFPYLEAPRIANFAHKDALVREIRTNQLEVVFIDPSYIMLAGTADKATNLIATGEVLGTLTTIMAETGVTPICLYHNKKSSGFEIPELNDMQYGGMPAFAGQWIMIGPRAEHDANLRQSKIWMNVGGRMGQGGRWGVNIDELPTESGCPRWEAQLLSDAEAHAEKRTDRAARQADQLVGRVFETKQAIMCVLNSPDVGALTRTQIADATKRGKDTRAFKDALAELLDEGLIEEVEIPAGQTGNHKAAPGYQRTSIQCNEAAA